MKINKKNFFLDRVAFSEKEIIEKIKQFANELNSKFKDKELIIIIILSGGIFFGIELIKYLDIKYLKMDFLSISSYEGNIKKKEIKIKTNLKNINLKNKNVLVIEDIVDSGKTIELLDIYFKKYELNFFQICSLIKSNKQLNFLNHIKFKCLLKLDSNDWVVGFGLDYEERYRFLKNIYFIKFK